MKRYYDKRKAALALMLAATLGLFNGCVGQMRERALENLDDAEILLDAEAPQADAFASRQEIATLYFLSEDGTRLSPVTRVLTLEEGISRSEAALRALLAGPLEEEAGVSWPEIGVLGDGRVYELSGGVATVDLPARVRVLTTEQLYGVRLAITTTLTEFSEVAYVNVLVGGCEEGVDLAATMPAGTLTRTEDLDVAARYARQDEIRLAGAGLTRMTTLYFPSADGKWILPEVRSVVYAAMTPIEYLYTLLTELGKRPESLLAADDIPAPMRYIEEMPEIVRTEDGAYRAIELRFSAALDDALAEAGLTRGIYLAMITDTLMGFVPGVEGVQISIGGEKITSLLQEDTPRDEALTFAQTVATREDFNGYVGAPAVIYLPAQESGKLEAIACVLAQERQNEPRARLTALLDGLQQAGALTDSLTAEDILAAEVDSDRLRVNLSAAFAEALAGLAPEQERLVVYAMVNTLTEGIEQQRVAFFFDGAQKASLAGGLELRGDLMRNPGMVVNP